MSSKSPLQECEVIVVAVSGASDNRWSWRIVDRSGQRLLESSESFAQLGEALEDGRRHVRTALGADIDSSPTRDPADTRGLSG
jgi:hypothetical protein